MGPCYLTIFHELTTDLTVQGRDFLHGSKIWLFLTYVLTDGESSDVIYNLTGSHTVHKDIFFPYASWLLVTLLIGYSVLTCFNF